MSVAVHNTNRCTIQLESLRLNAALLTSFGCAWNKALPDAYWEYNSCSRRHSINARLSDFVIPPTQ